MTFARTRVTCLFNGLLIRLDRHNRHTRVTPFAREIRAVNSAAAKIYLASKLGITREYSSSRNGFRVTRTILRDRRHAKRLVREVSFRRVDTPKTICRFERPVSAFLCTRKAITLEIPSRPANSTGPPPRSLSVIRYCAPLCPDLRPRKKIKRNRVPDEDRNCSGSRNRQMNQQIITEPAFM